MLIHLSGIVVIVGNYGSGKTEVAINLAVHQKQRGSQVKLADLDLVNPYFRTREARQALTSLGVEVILPPEELLQADLPILMPQVAGMIRNPGDLAILDVGGDDVGCTVLAALADAFNSSDNTVHMLQVINPLRPNTDTLEGCLNMRAAIEASSRLTVNGWVGNAHLMEETTREHILNGHSFMQKLAADSGLGVEFITMPQDLLPLVDPDSLSWPILPIHRQLVPPWKNAVALPAGNH